MIKIIFLGPFMPSQTGQKSKVKYFINFHISSIDLVNSTKNAVIFKILAVLQCLVNIPRLRDFYFFYFYLYAAKNEAIWCRSKFQTSSTFRTRYLYLAATFAGILFAWAIMLGVEKLLWKYFLGAWCCRCVFWNFCLTTSNKKFFQKFHF